MYSGPLNNPGLNCSGPLTCGLFATVSTTVLQDPWLVESMNMEPRTQKKRDTKAN